MALSIRLIGVPMDLGQDLRGVDVGPSALRYAGLAQRLSHLGHHVEDQGNIEVAVRATSGNTRLRRASAFRSQQPRRGVALARRTPCTIGGQMMKIAEVLAPHPGAALRLLGAVPPRCRCTEISIRWFRCRMPIK